jgi:hypothetical protein
MTRYMRDSAVRWGWLERERVRLLGKQVNGSGGPDGWGGCTVRYSARHVVNADVRGCCTHGRTQSVKMEQYARVALASELCGTWLNADVLDACKIVRNCGCCRFKDLKVLAVVRHEIECLNEVRCNGDSYYMT